MPQDKPVSPRSSRTKSAQINQSESFLIIIILGIVVTLILSAVSIGQLEKRQQKIMDVYNDHTAEMCAIISRIDSLQRCDSTLTAKDAEQLTSRLESIVAEARSIDKKDAVVHLLELEFNKIQSEYEELSIWSGILGVIFLVFSFFSLYKGDDVIKQASETLTEIQDIRDSVADKSDELDQTVNNKIKELSKKISPQEEKLKKLVEDIAARESAIKDFETRLAELNESAKKFRQDLSQSYDSDLKSFSEAVTEQIETKFQTQLERITNRLNSIDRRFKSEEEYIEERNPEEDIQDNDVNLNSDEFEDSDESESPDNTDDVTEDGNS